jgi:mannose-1-phosphate guanylyltransferase/mannose-6-phosphate isomerase
MLYPVILVGGSGTRLWPLSRISMPKQFLSLVSDKSMLQETVLRLRGIEQIANPVLVCNEEHRFLVAEQIREIKVEPEALILEPEGRNTAPAMAVAALQVVKEDPNGILLVLPSDHVIEDIPGFHRAVADALKAAQLGYLVTFGVVPRAPETGYGYIQQGQPLSDGDGSVFAVSRFVEKPDAQTAQAYLDAGNYLWNSGMFMFPAQVFLDEMEKFHPEILTACRAAIEGAQSDLDFCRLEAKAFSESPSIPVDIAVMEKTERAAVVPVSIGWNDVGSFSALWEVQSKDEKGNATRGEVFLHDAENCYVSSEKRLVSVLGVENLIVVETSDAVLVANKDRCQDVKKIVGWLEAKVALNAKHIARYIVRGAVMKALKRATVFRSSNLSSNPASVLPCKCTITAPSTGLWCAARRK